jgi:hypothetical protein
MSKASKEKIIKGSRRSPRVVHFATKVTPEFDALIRQEAHHMGAMMAEMLEKYQEAYIWKKEYDRKKKAKPKEEAEE